MRRHIFDHELLEFKDLEEVYVDGKRHYRSPLSGALLKSVTTVLGEHGDKSGLEKWRTRVGDEQADRISHQATRRGTSLHSICERYLLNEETYPPNTMPAVVSLFKGIKPLLNRYISTIYAIEAPMFSDYLGTAGRTDCIALWNGDPAIIDFKTAGKLKKEEYIHSYFLQATTYSLMLEEMVGMVARKLVIIIAVEHENVPQLFVKNRDEYIEEVLSIFTGKKEGAL